MNKFAKRARELHDKKYNCCQSTVLAFKDELGIDEETLAKLTVNFGGGLGYAGEVCGVVAGMAIISGYFGPFKGPEDQDSKKAGYEIIKELVEEFREITGHTRCPELLEIRENGGNTCMDLIEIGAKLVADKMGLK